LSNFHEARKILNEQERILKKAGNQVNLDLHAKVKFLGRNTYERAEEDEYIEEDFEEEKEDSIEELDDE
jgi:ubiquinone/menaquinone biosynthesis C-methylase UbiE